MIQNWHSVTLSLGRQFPPPECFITASKTWGLNWQIASGHAIFSLFPKLDQMWCFFHWKFAPLAALLTCDDMLVSVWLGVERGSRYSRGHIWQIPVYRSWTGVVRPDQTQILGDQNNIQGIHQRLISWRGYWAQECANTYKTNFSRADQ